MTDNNNSNYDDDLQIKICQNTGNSYFPEKNSNGLNYTLCYDINENSTDTKFMDNSDKQIKNILSAVQNPTKQCSTLLDKNLKQVINTVKCIKPDVVSSGKKKIKPLKCIRACSNQEVDIKYSKLIDFCKEQQISKNSTDYYPTASICNIVPKQ